MVSRISLAKVILYEIGFFEPGDFFISVFTRINKCLQNEFYLNLYIRTIFPSINLDSINLTKKEKKFLIYHYVSNRAKDMLDFQPYSSSTLFFGYGKNHYNSLANIFDYNEKAFSTNSKASTNVKIVGIFN